MWGNVWFQQDLQSRWTYLCWQWSLVAFGRSTQRLVLAIWIQLHGAVTLHGFLKDGKVWGIGSEEQGDSACGSSAWDSCLGLTCCQRSHRVKYSRDCHILLGTTLLHCHIYKLLKVHGGAYIMRSLEFRVSHSQKLQGTEIFAVGDQKCSGSWFFGTYHLS